MISVPAIVVGSIVWESAGTAVESPVLRAVLSYGLLLFVLRLAGKRTLSEMTTFDFIVVLMLSEAVQPAMTGDDTSFTSAALIVLTLVAIDTLLGIAKYRSPRVSAVVEDVPTVLVREGAPVEKALTAMRVDIEDIMEAARLQHGLKHFREVRFAVLERSGGISIIPRWMPGDEGEAVPDARSSASADPPADEGARRPTRSLPFE